MASSNLVFFHATLIVHAGRPPSFARSMIDDLSYFPERKKIERERGRARSVYVCV